MIKRRLIRRADGDVYTDAELLKFRSKFGYDGLPPELDPSVNTAATDVLNDFYKHVVDLVNSHLVSFHDLKGDARKTAESYDCEYDDDDNPIDPPDADERLWTKVTGYYVPDARDVNPISACCILRDYLEEYDEDDATDVKPGTMDQLILEHLSGKVPRLKR